MAINLDRIAAVAALGVFIAGPGLFHLRPVTPAYAQASDMAGIGHSETITARATVKAIDQDTRTVTLQGADGNTIVLKVGPEVQQPATGQGRRHGHRALFHLDRLCAFPRGSQTAAEFPDGGRRSCQARDKCLTAPWAASWLSPVWWWASIRSTTPFPWSIRPAAQSGSIDVVTRAGQQNLKRVRVRRHHHRDHHRGACLSASNRRCNVRSSFSRGIDRRDVRSTSIAARSDRPGHRCGAAVRRMFLLIDDRPAIDRGQDAGRHRGHEPGAGGVHRQRRRRQRNAVLPRAGVSVRRRRPRHRRHRRIDHQCLGRGLRAEQRRGLPRRLRPGPYRFRRRAPAAAAICGCRTARGVIMHLRAKRTGLMLSLGGDAVVISMQ